jgi:hypothetical protein
MAPKNGWKFKGTGPVAIESMSNSGNITLIMAVSYYHGIIAYQASDRHVNQATFLEFLKKVKEIYERHFSCHGKKYAIFLDNLGCHKTKMVRKICLF